MPGLLLLTLLIIKAFPQNVAINANGSLLNKNAILDIQSANKGLLIPRMTTDARMKIEPTQGLMVYDINTNSFWYNDGKVWKSMSAPAPADIFAATSPWNVTGNAGTDNTNFLGTTDNLALNIKVNNDPSGRIDPIRYNSKPSLSNNARN
jgi:trimeric autotransporter adhesin